MSLPLTLYHYCSTSTFQAIIESKALRLSSLSLSNDSMEGKIVAHTIERLAKRDGLSLEVIQELLKLLAKCEHNFDGLGFCLSEKGDLLSQWRGYADDGTGVAIGFSSEYLDSLSAKNEIESTTTKFKLKKILYDSLAHESAIEPTYLEILNFIKNGVFRNPSPGTLLSGTNSEFEKERIAILKLVRELTMTLFTLFPSLYLLKSQAFQEEHEWRLLSHIFQGTETQCSYRTTLNRLIPYRNLSLEKLEKTSISELVLGPKHLTPEHVIKNFLRNSGFPEIKVRRSEASYR